MAVLHVGRWRAEQGVVLIGQLQARPVLRRAAEPHLVAASPRWQTAQRRRERV